MTTADRTPLDGFLDAEAQAQRLLEELQHLRDEAGSYETARTVLEEMGERVNRLIDETANAAVSLQSVIQTLREIGTGEILDGLRKQEELIQSSSSSIHAQLERAQAEVLAGAGAAAERGSVELAASTSELREEISAVRSSMLFSMVLIVIVAVGLGTIIVLAP